MLAHKLLDDEIGCPELANSFNFRSVCLRLIPCLIQFFAIFPPPPFVCLCAPYTVLRSTLQLSFAFPFRSRHESSSFPTGRTTRSIASGSTLIVIRSVAERTVRLRFSTHVSFSGTVSFHFNNWPRGYLKVYFFRRKLFSWAMRCFRIQVRVPGEFSTITMHGFRHPPFTSPERSGLYLFICMHLCVCIYVHIYVFFNKNIQFSRTEFVGATHLWSTINNIEIITVDLTFVRPYFTHVF